MKTTRFGIEIGMTGLSRKDVAEAAQTVLGGELIYGGPYYDIWVLRPFDGRDCKFTYTAQSDARVKPAASKQVLLGSTVLKW